MFPKDFEFPVVEGVPLWMLATDEYLNKLRGTKPAQVPLFLQLPMPAKPAPLAAGEPVDYEVKWEV